MGLANSILQTDGVGIPAAILNTVFDMEAMNQTIGMGFTSTDAFRHNHGYLPRSPELSPAFVSADLRSAVANLFGPWWF